MTTLWQPGMRITAARLNAGTSDNQGTGVVGASPDWTITTLDVRRSGKLVTVAFDLGYTGSGITGSASGNIGDISVATITDATLRPAHDYSFCGTTGYSDGAGTIYPSGDIKLRSWVSGGSIASGNSLAIAVTYVTA